MFKKGDKIIRVSVEHEIAYAGDSHSEKAYPVGSEATFSQRYNEDMFDIREPSSYYMIYGDWVLDNTSLENE